MDEGAVYTRDDSFRSRAEAHQRRYRADELRVADDGKYGHRLCQEAVKDGRNFLSTAIHDKARARLGKGKGVDKARTFGNMLSSQAMCFNLIGPLSDGRGLELAGNALRHFIDWVGGVKSIEFECTPPRDAFGDQSAVGGVDCDVLIECETTRCIPALIAIETKFVETEFSRCAFLAEKMKERRCPEDVKLDGNFSCCGYQQKDYRYWQRSNEHKTLRDGVLPKSGCPFHKVPWQLWVNHTLVHELASRDIRPRETTARAAFAVCAPAANTKLLGDDVIGRFRGLLADPTTFVFIPLEELVKTIQRLAPSHGIDFENWINQFSRRYLIA